jgi:Tropinone reductase 1
MWNLKNKKILVTGGSKGIGSAAVLECLNLGAEVLFTARNKDEVAVFENELKVQGHQVTGITGDVTVEADQHKVRDWIAEKWGSLDVLVNNAGINIRKTSMDYTPEEYRKVLEVNLIAPFELSRLLYPFLVKGKSPAIINVASVAALLDLQTGSPYAMSKAGMLQQTRSLATEWAKDGIRVNAVSPWFTVTPLTQGLLSNEERLQQIINITPLKRVARVEEMSGVIAFLAMEQASYITGQNIVVDGGMTISAF